MKFEEFENKISEKGYGIVAMNHYSLNRKRHLYCVILSKNKERAFQAEGEDSDKVFESLYNQIINFERQKCKT